MMAQGGAFDTALRASVEREGADEAVLRVLLANRVEWPEEFDWRVAAVDGAERPIPMESGRRCSL